MTNCRQTSVLILLIGFGSRAVLSQSRSPASNRAESRLQVTVDVAPVIQTPTPKQNNSNAQTMITYDLQKPSAQVVSTEETIMMTDESGHRIPVKRITVVAK
jgi:hypothetical protein